MTARILIVTVLLLSGMSLFAIDTEEPFDDPELQARYDQLIDEFRCLVCQNQPISDSNAGLAVDLRREIHRMISEGASDAQVRSFLVERYGDFVLYRPPFKPTTWLLWAAPFLLVAAGLTIAIVILRRRREMVSAADTIDTDEDTTGAL